MLHAFTQSMTATLANNGFHSIGEHILFWGGCAHIWNHKEQGGGQEADTNLYNLSGLTDPVGH